MRLPIVAIAVVVCLVSKISDVQADIVFGSGVSPASHNVGSYSQLDAMSAAGYFLGGGEQVLLVETNAPLEVPAAGAARIKALSSLLSTVTYTSVGHTWGIIELNVQNGKSTGSFQLSATDNFGNVWTSSTFSLGNGQNRVWAQAINNQTITKLVVQASGNLIQDIRQVRITQSLIVVPEPGSLALLCLASLATAFGLARRR